MTVHAEAVFSPLARQQIESLRGHEKLLAWDIVKGIEEDPWTRDPFNAENRLPWPDRPGRWTDVSGYYLGVTFVEPPAGAAGVWILTIERVGHAWG